jgi:hypothetical protein
VPSMFRERLVQSAANRVRGQGVWPQIIKDDDREQTWIRPSDTHGQDGIWIRYHLAKYRWSQTLHRTSFSRSALLSPSSLQSFPPSLIRPHQHTKQPTSKQTTPRTRLGSLSLTPEDLSCLHNPKLLFANQISRK